MAILNTTDEIREYLAVNKSATYDLLKPHILNASRKFLKPLLGKDQFDQLIAAHDALTETPEELDLLEYAQRLSAYYMQVLALPTMLVHFSDIGIQEQTSHDGSNNGPRLWVYNELMASALKAAGEAAEDLLQFLEENAVDYPLWTASDAYSFSHELFINSATEMGRYIETRGNYALWLSVRKYITNFSEPDWILPAVCQAQFDELKTQISANTVSANNAALIAKIKPVVAFSSFYEASKFINIIATPEGLRMANTGVPSTGRTDTKADLEQMEQFRRTCKEKADSKYTQLKQFIIDNISDYPLIEASDCYTVTKCTTPINLDQSGSTGFRVP